MTKRSIQAVDMGLVPYGEAHALQEHLVAARQRGDQGDVLLLLEHPAVVTIGRGTKAGHFRVPPETLRSRGVELFDIGRGGDLTYHGPGQLVVYPIISLQPDRCDVRRYVWSLEETMLRTVADYGLAGQRIQGLNGAWIGDRKVGAVGVRISRWVTMHGFALNANTELSAFELIVPCGIHGRGVTSLAAALGHAVSMPELKRRCAAHFARLYDAALSWTAKEQLAGARPQPR